MILYHRTTIAEARQIAKHGFTDEKWAFTVTDEHGGRQMKLIGVWLADRPLTREEGPEGDAVLEVNLELSEDALLAHEIRGVFGDARVWVVPAQLLNPHVTVRILEVDPRSSWFFEAQDDEDGGEQPGVDEEDDREPWQN